MRLKELDLARGFTVFVMPAVHSILIYGNLKAQQSFLAGFLYFLAEWPGAQLFLFLMGFSITLSSVKTTEQIIKKGVLILASGYLLNFIKLCVPAMAGILTSSFYQDFGFIRPYTLAKLLFMGDILQCAGIVFVIISFLYRLKYYYLWSFLLALIVPAASLFLFVKSGSSPSFFAQSLIAGNAPASFFPIFPWASYACSGLAMGYYLKNTSAFYAKQFLLGAVFLIFGLLLAYAFPQLHSNEFYKPAPMDVMIHTGFVMLWITLWYWLLELIKDNSFLNFLTWLSKRITSIYLLQWMLIFWLIPLFGYHSQTTVKAAFAAVIVTALSFLLVYMASDSFKPKTFNNGKNL